MQPTKHMDPSEDELIARIKDNLMSHEEPYVPGAWERFNNEGKKKKPLIFWIGSLSSAAAVFLIATGLYFFINNKSSDSTDGKLTNTAGNKSIVPEKGIKPREAVVVNQSPVKNKSAVVSVSKTKAALNTERLPASESADVPDQELYSKIIAPASVNSVPPVGNPVKPASSVADSPVNPGEATNPVTAAAKEGKEKKPGTFQDFLNNESVVGKESKTSAIAAAKENKWAMGVMVAPSFGNTKKLNMGYGVSMDYAVSKKVSLGSGISYNELAASRDAGGGSSGMMDSPSPASIARTTKSLESVEARVVGIDIPFEVKYHFSKSFYANVGVSAFAVINQKQSNSYVEQKLVERPPSSLTAGATDNFSTFLVAEKTTEKVPEDEVSGDKYLGFYNFSFGYKQKISKSNSVSVEPFIKVPMKEVSKENLRMTGTGVRLKFDF